MQGFPQNQKHLFKTEILNSKEKGKIQAQLKSEAKFKEKEKITMVTSNVLPSIFFLRVLS